MKQEEIIEIKKSISNEVNNKLQNSVIPIFKGTSELHIEQIGTGFYISYKNNLYVITANHVFKEDFNVLYPDSETTLGTIPYENPFASETVDLAVYPLKEPLKYIFKPYILSENLINNYSEGKFFCCGYPATKCKFFNKQVKNIFKTFISEYESNPNNEQFKIDPRFEIPITFNRKDVISYTGENISFPYPNGMSGGPLFSFNMDDNKQLKYEIAGILTRYDANNEKTMVATNMRLVQLMLDRINQT